MATREASILDELIRGNVIPPGLTAGEGALDLLPIPAVVIGNRDGALHYEIFNRAFRLSGLGVVPEHSTLAASLKDRIAAFLDDGETRVELPWRTGDAVESRHFRVTIARIRNRIEPRCLVTLVDQTGEVRTEQNLRREMATDSLTGLPNRTGFTDRLEARLGEHGQRLAVMVIDVDRFSRVNACLGGLAGDELLITVARRIKSALRASDVLGRIGGDEFGVILSIDEDQAEADHVAKRIQGALAVPFRLSDYEIRVSCAIGIAHVAEANCNDAEELTRHAQFAVKRSKKSGRSEAYRPRDFAAARAQFGMETALRRALDRHALTLNYQPICDLTTGRVSAFEALARWTDEDGRVVTPTEFIPVAEESGLIVPLGRWAVREATRTLAEWDARAGGDCGVRMAVNLSAIQLQRDAVALEVEVALASAGLRGDRLKLELTESAIIADPDRITSALHALKGLGATIAMDDFGTGYSNLGYLQTLPIDILKIDRSFVTGMLTDRDKIAIVRAVLSLAQALGKETVAEGIESQELGQTLAALGCTYGQGYAYARPLDRDAAYSLLAARNA